MDILDDMGLNKLSAKVFFFFFLKLTTPFNGQQIILRLS